MLAKHWKIPKKIIKISKIKNLDGYINKRAFAEIEINNDELLPKWSNKKLKIVINGYSPKKNNGQEATIKIDGQRFSFVSISQNVNINHFDKMVQDLVLERYIPYTRPLFTRIPFNYTKIPVPIRTRLHTLFQESRRGMNFPSWPIEKSVELIRYLFIASIKLKLGKRIPYISFWPENKELAYTLTHDCDSASSFRSVDKIREIEKKYGFVSSWNIVPNKYRIDHGKLKKLRKEGCEIGLHGYDHSGKIAYQKESIIKNKLSYGLNKLSRYNVSGFRSELLLRNSRFLNMLSKNFTYDSSIPDTDIKSALSLRNGCCTVFPFFVNNMVELPLTMPQDWRLIRMGLKKPEMLELWKKKIDYIKDVNGLVNINMHPDDFISGNEEYLGVYDAILRYASKIKNKWHALPLNIAEWWIKRSKAEIKGKKLRVLEHGNISYF